MYVVLSLGPTGLRAMVFGDHLLEETTLRTHLKPSYLPHMQEKMRLPFVVSSTCAPYFTFLFKYTERFLDDCL